ncbi:hypothetical protein IWZ00DRAFT_517981 [Phyllosticta capitalensis]
MGWYGRVVVWWSGGAVVFFRLRLFSPSPSFSLSLPPTLFLCGCARVYMCASNSLSNETQFRHLSFFSPFPLFFCEAVSDSIPSWRRVIARGEARQRERAS